MIFALLCLQVQEGVPKDLMEAAQRLAQRKSYDFAWVLVKGKEEKQTVGAYFAPDVLYAKGEGLEIACRGEKRVSKIGDSGWQEPRQLPRRGPPKMAFPHETLLKIMENLPDAKREKSTNWNGMTCDVLGFSPTKELVEKALKDSGSPLLGEAMDIVEADTGLKVYVWRERATVVRMALSMKGGSKGKTHGDAQEISLSLDFSNLDRAKLKLPDEARKLLGLDE